VLAAGGPFVRSVTVLVAGAALAAGAGLAGCGTPPELRPRPGSSVPRPPSPSPSLSGGSSPSGAVLPPGETANPSPRPSFAEEYAVACGGHPTANQVIALVRRTGGLLPAGGSVPAQKGPLCAGTWQYTVFAVPNKEPLQVVSRGEPDSLTMVTAGTDICSIRVRTEAPAGIRNAALCPAPGT
jgi:hypothetical protein